MTGCALILTTCASRDDADRIADALVAERLVACVQIERIDSVYRWEGRVERGAEWRLQIKTTGALAPKVEARIAALHGYALPEIVRLPIEGSAAYLEWIEEQVRP